MLHWTFGLSTTTTLKTHCQVCLSFPSLKQHVYLPYYIHRHTLYTDSVVDEPLSWWFATSILVKMFVPFAKIAFTYHILHVYRPTVNQMQWLSSHFPNHCTLICRICRVGYALHFMHSICHKQKLCGKDHASSKVFLQSKCLSWSHISQTLSPSSIPFERGIKRVPNCSEHLDTWVSGMKV